MSSDPVAVDVELFAPKAEESDRCGTGGKAKHPLLRIASRQGTFWIPCHQIAGLDELADRFVIHFRATMSWSVEGEIVAMEGAWTATVSGLRLDSLLIAIGSGTRWTINNGGTQAGTGPYVTGIDIEPVETVGYEPPRP